MPSDILLLDFAVARLSLAKRWVRTVETNWGPADTVHEVVEIKEVPVKAWWETYRDHIEAGDLDEDEIADVLDMLNNGSTWTPGMESGFQYFNSLV